jgi:phosphoserine phosphatase RsbU/P
MKILIAEDDSVSRRVLQLSLMMAGHEVIMTQNGAAAWEVLQREDSPALAILDWMMPDMDGLEVCQLVRQQPTVTPVYIILLTAKTTKDDVIQGLRAGANDYIFKPFDREELYARVKAGETVVRLQQDLASRIRSVGNEPATGKQLQGILPICSYCKDIRDDQDCWQRLDSYITKHSEAQFSHSICPSCYQSVLTTLYEGPVENSGST